MDGSPGPVEVRRRLSALGGAGAVGVWRAALPVLSASFLDIGRRARRDIAMENCARRLLLDRTHARGSRHVPRCQPLAAASGCTFCRRILRPEPLPLADPLLAERLRGIVGGATAAASLAVCLAPQRSWPPPDLVAESGARRGLAHKCTRGPDDPIFRDRPRASPGGA